jgi:hypothetical protein
MVGAIAEFAGRLLEAGKAVPGAVRDWKRKKILREMLKEPTYEWRNLTTLARSIGASEEKTRDLLISIGARASTSPGESEHWGLISRVGSAGTRATRRTG